MLGGRLAMLCIECGNKFHAWIIGQPEYVGLRALEATDECLRSWAVSGRQVSQNEWGDHKARYNLIKDELFRITGVWMEENKHVEEPTDAGT